MNGDQAPTSIRLGQAWTWPNVFTLIRLLAIPVFIWLLVVPDNKAAAAWLLAALGTTDWVDGWLARRLNQATPLGALFDPLVDRLLFLVAIPATFLVGALPLAVAGLSLVREGVVAVSAMVLSLLGAPRMPVTWEGKTGTFLLMFAFPMFLGSASELSYASLLGWLAWLFAVPGLVYSWYSALFQYLPEARRRWGDRPLPQ